MISSINNLQIKNILLLKKKAKARKEQKSYIVEGIRMFLETPSKYLIKTYLSESFYEEVCKDESFLNIKSKLGEYDVVKDHIFQSISDTVTPQGILSIVKQTDMTLDEIFSFKSKSRRHCFIVLEDIQDPGNLGTIIRTSEGAGVSAVIMSHNTVDIYNPKVVRSTMGSIFRVPFVYVDDLKETIYKMKEQGICIYAAHLKGSLDYDEANYTKPSAFMIGNEGNGLSANITSLADCLIKIPMCGEVESLNAANAATVLMYESFRQNRHKKCDVWSQ